MLSKIFSFSSKKSCKKTPESDVAVESPSTSLGVSADLEPSKIRVLVFRDCDRKGKTLLYDSKAYARQQEKTQDSKASSRTTTVETPCKLDPLHGCCTTQKKKRSSYHRPSSDSTMLGEMIFGSVAMTYKGSTVKVHLIRSPHQLLMTKVFSLRPRMVVSSCCSDNSDSFVSSSSQVDSVLESSSRMESDSASLSSLNNSPKDCHLEAAVSSTPVAVPRVALGGAIDPEDDSGFTASLDSLCLNSCTEGTYTPASSPCGSLQRRLYRSQVTSIDGRFNKKLEESSEEPNSPILRRQPKIGIGILFSLSENEKKNSALQAFFFAHFPLFDCHVYRLRVATERACCSRNSFSLQVTEAIDTFRESICNLLKTQRLKEPVWLNMMSFPDHRGVLCERFMDQFTGCLDLYNNRETNFFLASVLSAVLTHHLAWVPTVMPAGAYPSRAYLDKHSSQTLDLLAQSHPYNPLWAQLSDLYGAIGYPLKLARTIVTGKDPDLVSKLLHILSYFIRCTEVSEHCPERVEIPQQTCGDTLEMESEDCCFCKPKEDENIELDLGHKHSICNPCIEKSGLSICSNCQKLVPKELDHCTLTNQPPEISKKLLNGLPCCQKCGLLQRISTVDEIIRVNSVSGSCGCMPKWAAAKELSHFLNDISYSERSETFKCYCCDFTENLEDISPDTEVKSSFQCYCVGEDRCSHCNSTKNSFTTVSQNILDCTNENNSEHTLENVFLQLLIHDQFCSNLECKCSSKNSTGSLEIDLENCRDGLEKNEVESNDSYGPSGSLDSGFHQTSTCCAKNKEELECLSVDTLEDEDEFGPEELPLPGVLNESNHQDAHGEPDEWRKSNSFGRSLFAGVSEAYHPDFVLQGVTSNRKDFLPRLTNDLCMALQHSVVDDALSDAVCIIADTDNWTCELVSVKKMKVKSSSDPASVQPVEVSNLVLSMLSSVSGLWDVNMSAEFCLMHLEDRLKEIYLKSKVITEWLRDRNKSISRYELAQTLGIDDSDMMLLLAAASSHSPQGMIYIRQ